MRSAIESWIALTAVIAVLLPLRAAGQLDGLDWTFRVNGQVVNVNPDGTVLIPNISAPDLFGPGGPGTTPDFVSDDFVRVIGFSDNTGGVPLYAFSEFFRIRQGETYQIQSWTFTAVPPVLPESITAIPEFSTITELTQRPRVNVIGRLADGSEVDVTGAENWTSYRVSNLELAEIDANGVITPKSPGMVFITAVNEGATSVAQIDIALGDQLTTVDGFVQLANGTPVAGASVTLPGLGASGSTGTDGRFSIPGVPTIFGQIGVLVRSTQGGQSLVGFAVQLDPQLAGITDAGIIIMSAPSVDQNIWLGTSGDWDESDRWSQGSVPDAQDNVVIPAFRSDSVVTVRGGAFTVRNLLCDAEFEIDSTGTMTVNGAAELNGRFVMQPGASFVASGLTASLIARGLTSIDGGSLAAVSGGRINLPRLIHYRHNSTGNSQTRNLRAEGFGSELTMDALETVLNGTHYDSNLRFQALSGGRVSMTNLLQVVEDTSGDTRQRSVSLTADGFGSTILLNQLRLFGDVNPDERSAVLVRNGGEIQVPSLRTLQGVDLSLDGLGTLATGQITEFTSGRLLMNRLTADLSSLRDASGTTMEVEGISVTLEGLQRLDGASFIVRLGGALVLPGARTYFGAATENSQIRRFRAEGTGSRLSLPNLTGIRNGDAFGSDIEIEAVAGGQVDLSMVRQFSDDTGDTRSRRIRVSADGFGSQINLGRLESFIDENSDVLSSIAVQSGGEVLLGALRDLQGVSLSLSPLGNLNLATVQRFRVGTLAADGVAPSMGALVNAEYSTLQVQGANWVITNLSRVDGAQFNALVAGKITLPAVQVYAHQSTGNSQARQFRADGAGSEINLPGLKSIVNGTHYQSHIRLEAISGARINLAGLEQIADDRNGDLRERQVVVLADGFGSTVNLSGLRNFVDLGEDRPSAITTANGGAVTLVDANLLLVNVSRTPGAALPVAAAAAAELAAAGGPATGGVDRESLAALAGLDRDLGTLGARIALAAQAPPAFDANEIRWIGEADGLWTSITNWSTGRVPGPSDNVVIDLPNVDVVVTISDGDFRVRGMVCAEAIRIETGSLTVHGPAEISGGLSLAPGATLIASGEEARLIATSGAQVDGGSFVALKGGQIDLPTVTSYSHASTGNSQARTFLAIETGSRIELSGLTRLSNGTHYDSDIWIQALAGGTVAFPLLREIEDPATGDARRRQVILDARGVGSAIQIPAIQFFYDINNEQYSWFRALDGASIGITALKEASGVQFISNGTGFLPVEGLTYLQESRVDISGQPVSFPSLRDAVRTVFSVAGVPLSTPVLENADGCEFLVSQGGVATVPGLISYRFMSAGNSERRAFQSIGAGSLIALPNLLEIFNGENYDSDLTIEALAGGQIQMPVLAEVRDPYSGDFRQSAIRIQARGIGSRIEVPALHTIWDLDIDEFSSLLAQMGGHLESPNLRRLRAVDLRLDGSGSLVLTNLASLTFGQLTVSGAASSFPMLVDGTGTLFNADGVHLQFPALAFADAASFSASGGARMTFSALERYAHASTANHQTRFFYALESGSVLSFPALADVRNGPHHNSDLLFLAHAGAVIDLPLLEQMVDPDEGDSQRRQFSLQVDGYGASIQMPQLVRIRDLAIDERSILHAVNRGTLLAAELTTVDAVDLDLNTASSITLDKIASFREGIWNIAADDPVFVDTLTDVRGSMFIIDGHVIDDSTFAQIDGASFTVRNGGRLNLPGVTHYAHSSTGNSQTRLFRAEGAGSQIQLPNLRSMINGTHYDSDLRVEAAAGGQVDLSGVRQVVEDNSGDTRLRQLLVTSTGQGSLVNLRQLAYVQDINTDAYSVFVAEESGSIIATQLVHLVGVDVTVSSNSMVRLNGVREIQDSLVSFHSGVFDLPSLRQIRNTTLEANGGVVNLSGLASADASSLLVMGGGRLAAPALSVYSHDSSGNSQTRLLRAAGAGSRLELPVLTSVINGSHYDASLRIEAAEGGTIDLKAVGQIVEADSGDTRLREVAILADGAGSSIDLSALALFRDVNSDSRSSIGVANGGQINLNLPALVSENVDLNLPVPGAPVLASATSQPQPAASYGAQEPIGSAESGDTAEGGGSPSDWVDIETIEEVRGFLAAAPDPNPPATIRWIGESGNWTNLANWDPPRLPRPNDNVVIDVVPSQVTITLSAGSQRVAGFQCEENLTITGGSLTVHGPGEINGDLTLSVGTALVADGSDATLRVAGGVVADGASFYALYGGDLEVVNLQNYNHASSGNSQARLFLAFGPGSVLRLPALATITNGSNYDSDTHIEAIAGGIVQLPSLTQLVDLDTGDTRLRQFILSAEGSGSTIDVPRLVNLTDVNSDSWSVLRGFNGGQVTTATLREVSGTQLILDGSGSVAVSSIINFIDGGIYLQQSAAPAFAALVNANRTWVSVDGVDVTFPQVQTFDGGSVWVSGGGSATFARVITYSHASTANSIPRYFRAAELGSQVSFPELRSMTTGTHYDSDINIEAVDGGRVALPKVLQLVEPDSGDSRQRSMAIRAVGEGSVVDLAALVNFQDVNSDQLSLLAARRGGSILSPALRDLRGVHLLLDGESSVQTGEFFNFADGQIETLGAALGLGKLVTATGTSWVVDNAELTMTSVANVNGGSFRVSGGGRLEFPAVISYQHASTGNSQRRTFVAIEDGSRLAFPALKSLVNGEHYDSDISLDALVGGIIDLSQVVQFVDPNSGDTRQREMSANATGVGSEINLSLLATLIDQNPDTHSVLRAAWGGRLLTPALQSLQAVDLFLHHSGDVQFNALRDFLFGGLLIDRYGASLSFPSLLNAGGSSISIDGASATFPEMVRIDGGDLFVAGGGEAIFPKVVTYSHASTGNSQTHRFMVIEAGTELSFGALQTISNGTHYDSNLSIEAMVGGRINLGSVVQIVDPTDGDTRQREIVIRADGLSSVITLSSLSSFVDANPDTSSSITETLGGDVNYPATATLVNVTVP
jgi:hypothetical protein